MKVFFFFETGWFKIEKIARVRGRVTPLFNNKICKQNTVLRNVINNIKVLKLIAQLYNSIKMTF